MWKPLKGGNKNQIHYISVFQLKKKKLLSSAQLSVHSR